MTSYDEKATFLVEQGYIRVVRGEVMLSTKAVGLLTRTAEAAWSALVQPGESMAQVPMELMRDARRGLRELAAKHGTGDMVEVIYAEAVARDG